MIGSPSQAEMDQAFFASLTEGIQSQKVRIAFFPFQDGSLLNPDTTLESLFPILYYEMLSSEQQKSGYHPFVTLNAVKAKELKTEELFSDETMPALAKSLGATHAVYGMFQKQTGTDLRYFIKIAHLDQKKPVKTLEFTVSQGDRFFSAVAESLAAILKEVGVKPAKEANPYLTNAPSFEAIRFYAKGMENSLNYQETNLAIAKVWFEKAFTTSYHFKRALIEKARTLFMQALILRQREMDPTLLLTEARAALKEAGKSGSASRWENADAAFVAGASLLNGQPAAAALSLEKTVRLTPEDGIAHRLLSKAYAASGNAKSNLESEIAGKLNPCLAPNEPKK